MGSHAKINLQFYTKLFTLFYESNPCHYKIMVATLRLSHKIAIKYLKLIPLKTSDLIMFSGGIKVEHWLRMGKTTYTKNLSWFW